MLTPTRTAANSLAAKIGVANAPAGLRRQATATALPGGGHS